MTFLTPLSFRMFSRSVFANLSTPDETTGSSAVGAIVAGRSET